MRGGKKKIKKHWGGLSVGLLAVPFQYGLYVFGHLSKWFVFVLMFKFWSVYRLWNGRPTIGYNGLRIDVGGLSELPVSTPTNVYIEDNCFLASRKKCPEGATDLRASDDRVRPLTFICCYVKCNLLSLLFLKG